MEQPVSEPVDLQEAIAAVVMSYHYAPGEWDESFDDTRDMAESVAADVVSGPLRGLREAAWDAADELDAVEELAAATLAYEGIIKRWPPGSAPHVELAEQLAVARHRRFQLKGSAARLRAEAGPREEPS